MFHQDNEQIGQLFAVVAKALEITQAVHVTQHLAHLGLAEALVAQQISAFLLKAPVELVDPVIATAAAGPR